MRTLLFEIGLEELPARFLEPGLEQLAQKAATLFEANRLEYQKLQTYGTPRRMTLMVDLSLAQKKEIQTKRGPATKVAFKAGEPTPAAIGFAKSQGLTVDQLEVRETEGGEYLYAVKELAGENTEKILAELLPKLLASLNFPQSMRWGERPERFARPLRWLVALWGDEVIEFEWAGVTSGRLSRGHRFLSTGSLRLEKSEDYLQKLESNYVIADSAARKEKIRQGLKEEAQKLGGKVLEPELLLGEVTNLVEYPTVFAGSFDSKFLELPPEAIITPMRDHQRYFPVVDEEGKLLPAFLAVRNGTAESIETVARGNERVLLARLEDARFYYQVDQEEPFADRVENLAQIVYHEKLGSLREKTQRLEKLVAWLGQKLNAGEEVTSDAVRAAHLAKADLTTAMVGEFAELQGIMGREYALASGEKSQVATAIAEQYLPRFAEDRLPETTAGTLLALAEKMDAIAGCFLAGLIPTGSEDPYALRRAAIGIFHILLAGDYPLELRDFVDYAQSLYGEARKTSEILDFFWGRLRGILQSEGWKADLIAASLAVPCTDPVSLKKRGEAVASFQQDPDFENLLVAYNRAANLAQKAETREVNPKLFQEKEEGLLSDAVEAAKGQVALATEKEDWPQVLAALAKLRAPLDAFFEAVMVMAKEEELRENRLALLAIISDLFGSVVDFSRLEV